MNWFIKCWLFFPSYLYIYSHLFPILGSAWLYYSDSFCYCYLTLSLSQIINDLTYHLYPPKSNLPFSPAYFGVLRKDQKSANNRPFYSCVLRNLAINASEVGDDLVLIQTSLLLLCKSSCSYANYLVFT